MEEFLLEIDITPHMIYLALILMVIGKGLKELNFIAKWSVIWILMTISLIINFIFFGVAFKTFFEAILAVSLSTVIYQTYKQTNKGFRSLRNNKSK